jgi:hypothetical protein
MTFSSLISAANFRAWASIRCASSVAVTSSNRARPSTLAVSSHSKDVVLLHKSLPHGETSFAVRCAGLCAHHTKVTLPLKGCSYASCAAILSTRLMVQHNWSAPH